MRFKIRGKLSIDGVTYIGQEAKPKKRTSATQFIKSPEWQALRKEALSLYGAVCVKCGSEESVQVDHIKPKSKHPELALDISNLQPLCWSCNRRKSFFHETDYRRQSVTQ